MANANSPFGLRPVRHLDGSTFNGQTERFYVPSSDGTPLGIGSVVKLAGSADSRGVPTVIAAGATDTPVGVVVAFEPDPTDLNTVGRAADTARYVYVSTARDVVYEAQEDSDGGALDADDTGKTIRLIAGTVSDTGISGTMLDSNTAAALDEPLKLLRLVDRVDNAFGNYAKWEVMLNVSAYDPSVTDAT